MRSSSVSLRPFPGDLVEHLRAVAALARCLEVDPRGAFETTARELRVDASVLRRRIAALGRWLGAPIFEGRGPGLTPTAVGRAAVETAERVLGDLGRLSAGTSGAAARTRVAIGCTGTITREILPGALAALARAHPNTDIRVSRAGTAEALAALGAGELDIAVVRGGKAPPGFASRRLLDDRLWLAAPARSPIARSQRVSARELAAMRIITYGPASFTRMRVMRVLAPLGATMAIEVDGRSAALQLVASGLGIAFVSRIPGAPAAVSGVTWRDVDALFAPAAFWLVTRRDRSPSDAAQLLSSEIVAGAQTLARHRSRR